MSSFKDNHSPPLVKEQEAERSNLSPGEREPCKGNANGPQKCFQLISWMEKNKERYNDFSTGICSTMLAYATGGWRQIPSPKQTKHMVKYIDEWKADCEQDED